MHELSRFTAMAALVLVFTETLGASARAANGTQQQFGGILKVALDGDPQCLDPQQVGNNNSLNIGRQITDSLTDQKPETGEIVPWLASSWKIADDNRQFTFVLRDGVSFSDGSPVDAEAVKANFDGIVKMGARSSLGSTYLAGLKSITVLDPRTVQIIFAQPNAQFLQATSTMSLGLFSRNTLAKTLDERCQGQLTGSGPFVLNGFVHNQYVKLARRDTYAWQSSLAGHSGKAYLEGIEFRVVPESGVRNGSLLSRQLDVNTTVQPQDESVLQSQAFPILARSNPGVVYSLFPNESVAIANDPAVRRALNKGINRPELKSVISRFQSPATSIIAKTTPLYADQSNELAYDPQGARKLLDDAGWKVSEGGIRAKDGQKLAFRLDYWQSAPFLELVQQQLRAIGVDLQLSRSPISQVNGLVDAGKYTFQFYNLTRADPDIVRTVFLASGRNVNKRASAKVDDLLTQSSGTLNAQARAGLIRDANDILLRDGHSIPLVELATVTATGKNIHGLHYEASSRLQFYDAWSQR